jgi:uncharacterized protein YecT (DUF1311 family)
MRRVSFWPILPLLTLLCTHAVPGRAQVPNTTTCDSIGGQQPMNACFVRLADSADTQLRRLLDDLRAALPSRRFDELRATQSAWQRYRDGQCRWERTFVEGGTIAPMISAVCRLSLTQNRIAELRGFLCEGAPVMGPCEASQRYGDAVAEPDSVRPN